MFPFRCFRVINFLSEHWKRKKIICHWLCDKRLVYLVKVSEMSDSFDLRLFIFAEFLNFFFNFLLFCYVFTQYLLLLFFKNMFVFHFFGFVFGSTVDDHFVVFRCSGGTRKDNEERTSNVMTYFNCKLGIVGLKQM